MEEQDPNADESFSLEETIDRMEETQLCFHPIHHHSFARVSFLISGSVRLCAGCDKRLHSILGYESDPSSQLVRCLACGVYAHRTCAMVTDNNDLHVWKEKCAVNSKRIQSHTESDDDVMESNDASLNHSSILLRYLRRQSFKPEVSKESEIVMEDQEPLAPSQPETQSELKDEASMVWTSDGPPRHWANKVEIIGGSEGSDATLPSQSPPPEASANEDEPCEADAPVEISDSSFASVARAIQENVLVHFKSRLRVVGDDAETQPESDADTSPETMPLLQGDARIPIQKEIDSEESLAEKKERLSLVQTKHSSTLPKETRDALLKEVTPELPPTSTTSLMKLATGTYEIAKTSTNLQKKMGMVSVVGGIAGGVAGLVMAGPAGAVVGVKWGQTCGIMSVVIEGSVTAVVLVAGAAAGSYTAKQIQQHAEQRIISMGEEGSARKVLLVRPHVWIDPAWEQICEKAKREAPAVQAPRIFSIITGSQSKQAERAKSIRCQGDVDIVQAADFELPTDEKVLLLVSRILNDRLSLPGHAYRVLIQEHRKRANERKLEDISKVINAMERTARDGSSVFDDDFNTAASKVVRFRRLDAHAVIKHVTATLLEVRPGFASSPTITEMTATAVEGLVFGQLYDSVLEEILEETRCADVDLMAKIASFAQGKSEDLREMDDVSKKALYTLTQIPETHSPVDKLRECVKFLEQISDHFSAPNHKALGADSLLKMVCLHLVIANVPHMNAELVFLEEFARDERLLQGKEGYALVTLQASLHFLNASNDFENDIFFADDD